MNDITAERKETEQRCQLEDLPADVKTMLRGQWRAFLELLDKAERATDVGPTQQFELLVFIEAA